LDRDVEGEGEVDIEESNSRLEAEGERLGEEGLWLCLEERLDKRLEV
jgi:hypothetical protein